MAQHLPGHVRPPERAVRTQGGAWARRAFPGGAAMSKSDRWLFQSPVQGEQSHAGSLEPERPLGGMLFAMEIVMSTPGREGERDGFPKAGGISQEEAEIWRRGAGGGLGERVEAARPGTGAGWDDRGFPHGPTSAWPASKAARLKGRMFDI